MVLSRGQSGHLSPSQSGGNVDAQNLAAMLSQSLLRVGLLLTFSLFTDILHASSTRPCVPPLMQHM
jgi:hypothetical protein